MCVWCSCGACHAIARFVKCAHRSVISAPASIHPNWCSSLSFTICCYCSLCRRLRGRTRRYARATCLQSSCCAISEPLFWFAGVFATATRASESAPRSDLYNLIMLGRSIREVIVVSSSTIRDPIRPHCPTRGTQRIQLRYARGGEVR